ncbi:hypothetical protein [Lentilactobacillus parakefiri]|uniref:Uncharacterized protein n=1 Tax=Lentilactobacillus parakefiri TaxID=152332 RepID=A0A269XVH6_9LACO|nr:hypothetical protein [Lentilactobacillus parakefiri]KRL61077.1 lipoprotein [Lentilactobacillus parakefiri DSM 10551]PAK77265.1 hypothetical protein B8W98_11065 [Lentilactobacillus parakefiri]PAL01484.1 hypothetical protein B8W96_00780 [Lentilactobacillus parakefiri]TDG91236.1 hypothetical protein C5L28_002438 [Lentilactobacillus parakefiri]GAW71868.1 hypothetical protein LPKJCM_00971 [Lentilactobacillus parakefiri]
MKKWIWIVIAIVIGASVGGYAYARHSQNEKIYAEAMQRGRLQISNKKYTAAETSFTNALKRKPNDDQADKVLNQTQSFISANDLFNDLKFGQAKSEYQSVVDTKKGNELLSDRAKAKITKIKGIQKNRQNYNKIYNQALDQAGDGQYTESNSTLDKIFSDKSIHQAYYADILKKAETLRDKNNDAISGNSSSSSNSFESSTSDSSTNNNPNVSGSKGASLTSAEKKAAAAYKGSNEYTVTKGDRDLDGKPITAAQVTRARKQISAAGVDSNAMSDQDVRNVIKGAHKNGETIGQYVKARY